MTYNLIAIFLSHNFPLKHPACIFGRHVVFYPAKLQLLLLPSLYIERKYCKLLMSKHVFTIIKNPSPLIFGYSGRFIFFVGEILTMSAHTWYHLKTQIFFIHDFLLQVVGRLDLGGEKCTGTALHHWNEVISSPRRQIAEWHKLRE